MLKDLACFEFLKELEGKYKIKDRFDKLPEIIDLLAYDFRRQGNSYITPNLNFERGKYEKVLSGKFVTLFNCHSLITIENHGDVLTTKPISCLEALDIFTKASKACNSLDIINTIKDKAEKYLVSYDSI